MKLDICPLVYAVDDGYFIPALHGGQADDLDADGPALLPHLKALLCSWPKAGNVSVAYWFARRGCSTDVGQITSPGDALILPGRVENVARPKQCREVPGAPANAAEDRFFSKSHGEEGRGNRDERRVYHREAVHPSGLGAPWELWMERIGRLGSSCSTSGRISGGSGSRGRRAGVEATDCFDAVVCPRARPTIVSHALLENARP